MGKLITIKEAVSDVKEYVKGRMDGTITSWKTGYPKLNKKILNGIEWNSTITIGGRPSVGKSTYSDDIIDGSFDLNLDSNGKPDFLLLDFNWELSTRVLLLRRLAAKLKMAYKDIISSETPISEELFIKLCSVLEDHYGELPITFCEEPLSVQEFVKTVEEFCQANPGKKVVIRIDHTLLTKMTSSDNSQAQMLLNLLAAANILKKKYPIIFIFLTQLNREFEDRQEDGTDNAFPRQGDVYGGKTSHIYLVI